MTNITFKKGQTYTITNDYGEITKCVYTKSTKKYYHFDVIQSTFLNNGDNYGVSKNFANIINIQ